MYLLFNSSDQTCFQNKIVKTYAVALNISRLYAKINKTIKITHIIYVFAALHHAIERFRKTISCVHMLRSRNTIIQKLTQPCKLSTTHTQLPLFIHSAFIMQIALRLQVMRHNHRPRLIYCPYCLRLNYANEFGASIQSYRKQNNTCMFVIVI